MYLPQFLHGLFINEQETKLPLSFFAMSKVIYEWKIKWKNSITINKRILNEHHRTKNVDDWRRIWFYESFLTIFLLDEQISLKNQNFSRFLLFYEIKGKRCRDLFIPLSFKETIQNNVNCGKLVKKWILWYGY